MKTIPEKRRAVLYLRYSSSSQSEQSIEGQRTECMAYAKQEGLSVVKEYIDRATTASRDIEKRTSFNRMIKDAALHTFDVVLVYKLDRFSRDQYDFAVNKKKLADHGVTIDSVKEPISNTPEGQLMEMICQGFSVYFSKDLKQKVQRGMKESAKKAQYIGGPVPLGLKVDENMKFVIDEQTAPFVRRVFTEYLSGKSLREIAADLNNTGLRTSRGGLFIASSIQRMLTNPKYIGIYNSKHNWAENAIEPIIDKETFEKVGKMLQMNKRILRKRSDHTPEFLLTGKIFCGHCGHAMSPQSGTSSTGKVYYYYKCAGKSEYCKCKKKNERKELIESLVLEDVRKSLTDSFIDDVLDLLEDKISRDEIESELEALEAEAATIRKEQKNLTKAIALGAVSPDIIQTMNENTEKLDGLEARITEVKSRSKYFSRERIRVYLQSVRQNAEAAEDFGKPLITAFVDRVEVFDDDDQGGLIRIHYRIWSESATDISKSSGVVANGSPFETLSERLEVVFTSGIPVVIHTFRFNR